MNEEEIQVLIDKSKKQDMTAFALLVTGNLYSDWHFAYSVMKKRLETWYRKHL